MSNAPFDYGFEYLGVAEKLIQTPLTDRCYLTLTQALYFRMGGSPFGPAASFPERLKINILINFKWTTINFRLNPIRF
jgi:hypothetical protein